MKRCVAPTLVPVLAVTGCIKPPVKPVLEPLPPVTRGAHPWMQSDNLGD
jgi:hypothetical protein